VSAEALLELRAIAMKLLELVAQAQAIPTVRLLTLEQATERLAVGRTTAQELVDSGALPVVSVTGRAVRVLESDLEAFMQTRRARRG
jgi:excisionase family DNA binding protein